MPCECDPAQGYEELRKLADAATRAACDMRTILRRRNLLLELTTETRRWIKRHDIADTKRRREETASGRREKTRLAALKKLSLEERRALDL